MANEKELIIRDENVFTANKGVLKIEHYFESSSDRDVFYNTPINLTELIKKETVIAIKNNNTYIYQMWVNSSKPTSYEANGFIDVTYLATGVSGKDAKKLLFKWNGDKLGVKIDDPLITDWTYSESLKGIDGSKIENARIVGDSLVFDTREFKNNSLEEIKVDDFLPMIKSNIILGHYMGMLTSETIPIGKQISNGQWWKVGQTFRLGDVDFYINAIAVANKDTTSATKNDFDVYNAKLDELISKSLYILALSNNSINQIKDIRMQVDNEGRLAIQGYDSLTNSYVDFGKVGRNGEFENVITKDGIYLKDSTSQDESYVRLIGSAVTPNSISVGDTKKDLILVSKNPKIATTSVESSNQSIITNPNFSVSKSLASYSTNIKLDNTISIKTISARIDTNIGDYLIKVTDVESNEVVYTSRDEFEYNNGLNKQYKLSGLVDFNTTKPLYIRAGRVYKIEIKFANNVNMLGVNRIYSTQEINPNNIDYGVFNNIKEGTCYRINADGNITINNTQLEVKAGNSLICISNIDVVANLNKFKLENTNIEQGKLPQPEFVPYQVYLVDGLEFDEIAGKKYVDGVIKGGSEEVFINGNSTTKDSNLITTKLNQDKQIEFKRLTDVENNTYENAIIKDIALPSYPSLKSALDLLKAGKVFKGTFDPNIDNFSKFKNAKQGEYWNVIKTGTISGTTTKLNIGEKINCIDTITGIPTDLSKFTIEPAVDLNITEYTSSTETKDGLGGTVPTPPLGDERWLNSRNKWSLLPVLSSTSDGIVRKATTSDGTNFLCDDGTFKKISVREYQGATALSSGMSGLVPIATIAQRNHAFFGDGTYKPIVLTTQDNYFNGRNTFSDQVFLETNVNRPLAMIGYSGTPFNANTPEIYNLEGLVIHSSTVGTNNTITFCATGNSFNNITSDFVWLENDGTGGTTPPKQVMKLKNDGCLSIGNEANTNSISSLGKSILVEKEIYSFGRLAGEGVRVTAKNRSVDCTINANNVTATNKFLELPDETNATLATREWVNTNVNGSNPPTNYVLRTTSSDDNASNRNKFFNTYTLGFATTSLSLTQVYTRVGNTANQRMLQFNCLIKELSSMVEGSDGSRSWVGYNGAIMSAEYSDTSIVKTGLALQNNIANVSISSTTNATTAPVSGFLRLVLGRDIGSIYYINVAIQWISANNYTITVENTNGSWTSLENMTNIFVRTATGFTNGTPSPTNTLISTSCPSFQIIPVRNELWL